MRYVTAAFLKRLNTPPHYVVLFRHVFGTRAAVNLGNARLAEESELSLYCLLWRLRVQARSRWMKAWKGVYYDMSSKSWTEQQTAILRTDVRVLREARVSDFEPRSRRSR